MPSFLKQLSRAGFTGAAFLISAAALGGLLWYALGREPTFPDLPAGAYVGRISGAAAQEKQFFTLYVERIKNMDALLFVVFREGWKPQVVPAETVQKKKVLGYFGGGQALRPLTLSGPEASLTLTGSGSGSEFSGQTKAAGQHGIWSLSPVSVANLREPSPAPPEMFDLHEWLRLKGKAHSLSLQYEGLSKGNAADQERKEKLSRFLSEGDLLRSRALQRKEALDAELQKLAADVEAKGGEMKQLVRELGQLSRITRRGQAAELARRVAKREAKWYMVNWQQGADLSSMEESLAAGMKVDLLKLRANVKKAEEVQALKNTVAQERLQLSRLQQLYQQKVEQGLKTGQRGTPQEQPRSSWWQKWDSIFGENER